MSELPPRPSLAHLRKQARELLSRLRAQDPNATLSDAQHVLAGEYGFASWPKLKAHVEAAAAAPPLFPRLTSKARQCLFFARFEASHAGSPSIEPEHLLLGLMKASQGLRNGLLCPSAATTRQGAPRGRSPIAQRRSRRRFKFLSVNGRNACFKAAQPRPTGCVTPRSAWYISCSACCASRTRSPPDSWRSTGCGHLRFATPL